MFHFANEAVSDDELLNEHLGYEPRAALTTPNPEEAKEPYGGVADLLHSTWTSAYRLIEQLEDSSWRDTVLGAEVEAFEKRWSVALGVPVKAADLLDSQNRSCVAFTCMDARRTTP